MKIIHTNGQNLGPLDEKTMNAHQRRKSWRRIGRTTRGGSQHRIVRHWADLAELPESETHRLEIDVEGGNGWIHDKRMAYTLHFNAVSSDRPDMFHDKVCGFQRAIEACDALMHGPCSLVPSRKAGIKAWVCARVKATSSWNPSKTTDHAIAVHCNFDPKPTSKIIHARNAAKHGLVFQTNTQDDPHP